MKQDFFDAACNNVAPRRALSKNRDESFRSIERIVLHFL